jgi:signal peptidase II
MKNKLRDYILKLSIVLLIILLDITTKVVFENYFKTSVSQRIVLIPNLLSLTFEKNTGAAFGIFDNGTIYLAIFSIVFLFGFFVYDYFNKDKNVWYVLSFSFIIGGAIGNFIDRIFLGYVRDFIMFDFINFPIFNIADMSLTFGVICYFVYILFFYNKKEKNV